MAVWACTFNCLFDGPFFFVILRFAQDDIQEAAPLCLDTERPSFPYRHPDRLPRRREEWRDLVL